MLVVLSKLIGNFGYILILIFFLSRGNFFKQFLQKEKLKLKEEIILSILFGCLGIFGTYSGVLYEGAIANIRNMSIVFGGMLCGPVVGISSGLIAGVHRIVIDVGGITALPCGISTILGGILSAYLYKVSDVKNRWVYAMVGAMIIENLSFGLMLIISKPFETAVAILKAVYIPMVLINGIGAAVLMSITENIFKEKEQIAANQSKLALEIADRTLPYFMNTDEISLVKICDIIKESVEAKAVVISNTNRIIAASEEIEFDINEYGSGIVEKLIKVTNDNDLITITNKNKGSLFDNIIYKSAVAAPLYENNEIIGILIFFYYSRNAFRYDEKTLIKSLSKLISTQLELIKINNLKKMAAKAEVRALQMQINPHFLFNVLNTIVSFIRIDPDKARELIIDFSKYLRYNTENKEEIIDIKEEIKHVKSYIKIEQARFGEKIKIEFDIDDNIDAKIPMLSIQPLVENAIRHGMKDLQKGISIVVKAYKVRNMTKLVIEDNGVGIDEEIIEKVYNDTIESNKVGLINVHQRLLLLYGSGLKIERLERGTRIQFLINEERANKINKGEKYELYNS